MSEKGFCTACGKVHEPTLKDCLEASKSPENGQKYRKYGLLMFALVLIAYLYAVFGGSKWPQ